MQNANRSSKETNEIRATGSEEGQKIRADAENRE